MVAAPFVIGSALLLAACGGGGGGGGSALPPTSASLGGNNGGGSVAPPSIATPVPVTSNGSGVAVSIAGVATTAKSASAQFAGAAPGTLACSAGTCSGALAPPAGAPATLTFAILDGSGNAIASGSGIAVDLAHVAFVLGGAPAQLTLAINPDAVDEGNAASVVIAPVALDANGRTIAGGSGSIALSSDDTTGASHLANANVALGGTTTLSYDGTVGAPDVTLTATSGGAPAAVATMTYRRRAGAARVKTYAYYGLNDVNSNVPASWMATHVDIVEDDGFTAQHADAFKRAGGATAIAYTDPSYVPHCFSPFKPPAGRCDGPIGNLNPAEDAYLHDASGARINRYNGPDFQYQEALNPASASARNAYATTAANIVTASPRLDGFFADDSGSTFSGGDGVLGSSLYYGFNTSATEIGSDAAYQTAAAQMLAAAGKPVIVNGGDPSTWGPAYGGAFLAPANVLGQNFEGCFAHDGIGLENDTASRFTREANGLLAVTALHKLAVCMEMPDANVASRLYVLAAWWLTYDPAYSVLGNVVPLADGAAVYPETTLVPSSPRKNAGNDVATLRVGGLYIREFATCYRGGSSIGACAAVVNSATGGSAALPSTFATKYTHQIALDPTSLYAGGKANVVAGIPASIPATSGAILVR